MTEVDVFDEIQTELKANMAEMGLIDHNGRPTDAGAIIIQGQGHNNPSPHNDNHHSQSKKKKKNLRKKKNHQPELNQPTDEDIHLKQQVVDDVRQALKSGVSLKHVPFPEDYLENSGSEPENEDNQKDVSIEKNHDNHDLHANQSDDDELFDAPIFPTTDKLRKSKTSPPSVVAILWRFCGIIQIIPLILCCAFNTFLLFFISKILSFCGYIFSSIKWFISKIGIFLPHWTITVIQYCSNMIVNLNGCINGFVDAKKQENEDKIQQTYEIIVNYSRNLVGDYQKIDDSIQDYTPTFRMRDNFNFFFVLSIRSIVWLTIPFFEYFKMQRQERKMKGSFV